MFKHSGEGTREESNVDKVMVVEMAGNRVKGYADKKK